MNIVVLRVILFIGNANSLKTKRMVLQSLKTRIRNKFNVSVSEVDEQDKWQKSTLAVVGVGSNKKYMDGQFDKIINFIENFTQVSIVDYEMEMF